MKLVFAYQKIQQMEMKRINNGKETVAFCVRAYYNRSIRVVNDECCKEAMAVLGRVDYDNQGNA